MKRQAVLRRGDEAPGFVLLLRWHSVRRLHCLYAEAFGTRRGGVKAFSEGDLRRGGSQRAAASRRLRRAYTVMR